MVLPAMHALPPRPRRYGSVNWLGLWTLSMREIRRFTKVHTQTIAAPVVTTLLFLAVFVLALGPQVNVAGGISFAEFLAPGLIMMAMTQNAFANTSSSLVIAKVQGNIVDSLMPPLSPGELVVGFAAGGIVRGLVVGLVVAACLLPFVPLHVHAWGWILFNGLMASALLSLLGIAGGVWSEKFDHRVTGTVPHLLRRPCLILTLGFFPLHPRRLYELNFKIGVSYTDPPLKLFLQTVPSRMPPIQRIWPLDLF